MKIYLDTANVKEITSGKPWLARRRDHEPLISRQGRQKFQGNVGRGV